MNYNLSCHDYYEDDNYYWFSELNFNGFYKVDKYTLTSELVFHFPNEDLNGRALYNFVEKVGDCFVFSPTRAKNIIIYNAITKEMKSFELKECAQERKIKYINLPKFNNVIKYNNTVFFIPVTYPAIVKLNLDTMKLEYIDDWVENVEGVLDSERKAYLNMYFFMVMSNENNIILPLACSNHILLFDMLDNSSELIEIKTKSEVFNSVVFDGNDYWFTPRVGGGITKWNMENRKSLYIETEIDEINKERNLFKQPVVYKNKLYISSTNQHSSPYIIDIETESVKKNEVIDNILSLERDFFRFPGPAMTMFCVKLVGNTLNFISGIDYCWYSVNLDTEEVTRRVIQADEVGRDIMWNEMAKKDIRVLEKEKSGIQELCEYINEFTDERNKLISTQETTAEETVGYAILRATT